MISKHISLSEATKSPTATRLKISNEPTAEQIENMKSVAENCFEPLRAWWGKPIVVTSFFRSEALNKAIGGSTTSQHCKGEAIDISAGSQANNKALFNWLRKNVVFDQVIGEDKDAHGYSWIHISFKRNGQNRMEVLEMEIVNGKQKFKKL